MTISIVLHQFEISPFCQKVAKALQHKGLTYSTIDYNGVTAAKAQILTKVGKLPVLDIGGERIQDSTKIVRYLDEQYPNLPLLYPSDPQQKAVVELWEDWSDELLYWYEVYFRVNDPVALEQAVVLLASGRPRYEKIFAKPLMKFMLKVQLYMQGLGKMAAIDIITEFERHLDRIEGTLANSGWLVGAEKTVADIAVATQLAEIVRTSESMQTTILDRSNIRAWLEKQ